MEVVSGLRETGWKTSTHKQTIENLYRLHASDARRLAYLLTGSKEAADDITQDAFIRVIGRLAHLRDPSSFGPYLRRTIVNVARMQFRRKAIERRYLEAEAANPTKVSALEREVDELQQALMQLPYRQRAAIVLRFFVDLPDNESAEILGCATGTVRSLISRGLVALRQNERIG